jgi:hypothetical protein
MRSAAAEAGHLLAGWDSTRQGRFARAWGHGHSVRSTLLDYRAAVARNTEEERREEGQEPSSQSRTRAPLLACDDDESFSVP